MVGKDPDLNKWNFIQASDLLIPLDVHVQRIMERLGVIKKTKGCKWENVNTISDFLKKVDPINPITYDFAISRLGILDICLDEKSDSECKICPLKKFCE